MIHHAYNSVPYYKELFDSGLDVLTSGDHIWKKREIFEIITKINHDQKTSFLIVEQNAFRSLEVANYAYVLETGRMTLEGEASTLIDHPHVKKAYLGR
jgi:ABC-type branched-subunit amino acid transport system ATPase component